MIQKRCFDIVLSLIGIFILIPALLIISLLVRFDSKGPILFKQIRVGRFQKEFKILKFRTMVIDAESLGRQITVGRDPRITRVGFFLRKYKLDELPQIFNVFLGDMSFVGPRPEVPYYVKFYNEEQRKIFSIRPGITDFASIKYFDESRLLAESDDPNGTYIDQIMVDKLDYNLEYLKNRSLKKDIFIIFLTFMKLTKTEAKEAKKDESTHA